MAPGNLQQGWIRFLTEPQPMPSDAPSLESFQALQKGRLRDLIGEALKMGLLQPEPLLVQFVHIRPDDGNPYFGVTTVGKDCPQLPVLVAFTALHLQYVEKANISFFKNAAALMNDRGIVAVFSTRPPTSCKLANSDFISVEVSNCDLYKVDLIPGLDDFEDLPNAAGFRSLSDTAFQGLMNELTTEARTLKEPRILKCDPRMEEIIGPENKSTYLAHLAPLLVRHHVICCAPILYDHGAETKGKPSGTGGCVFLMPADQRLTPANLEGLYLFTHKLCTMAAVIPEIAAAISQSEVRSFSEEVKDRFPAIVSEVEKLESDFERIGLFQRSSFEKARLPLFNAVAKTNIPVLITGDTGSGKETTAKKLAKASGRDKALVRIYNCANIGAGLAESELFGYVKGSFTDGNAHKLGAILAASGYADGSGDGDYRLWLSRQNRNLSQQEYEGEACWGLADGHRGGTLILDEFGSLDPEVEAKLLRAIDGRPIRPKAWNGPGFLPYVRIICITNESLETTRLDLRHRIGGFHIQEPKLSEKLESVEAAIEERFTRLSMVDEPEVHYRLAPSAKSFLLDPQFLDGLKGNFRELKWLVQRACLHTYLRPQNRGMIKKEDVQKALEHRLRIAGPLPEEPGPQSHSVDAYPEIGVLRNKVSGLFPALRDRVNWALLEHELSKLDATPETHDILAALDEAFELCRGDKLKIALQATIKADSIHTSFGRICLRLGYRRKKRGRYASASDK